ncbi:transmembrane signal receptor [Lithospermum erythrorhizon]|uniref:Receptor-like serine/threonine-protein kinase n=1 Tax=Lithospermum erythrorhizon TaxID=34254 RepID=A0AAV3PJ36_LITER
MDKLPFVLRYSLLVLVILSCAEILVAIDSLNASRSISHNETLISAQGQFQLGFFKTGSSPRSYLGIWYNVDPNQIVWVANRDSPLNDTSGVLTIQNDGNLVLLADGRRAVWSTNVQNAESGTVSAQLLDTGNLVLKEINEGTVLWQSFDHPAHAMIAGMKLGWDLRISLDRNLTSWKNTDDPAKGEYTYGIRLHGLAQVVIWKGSSIHYRSGPWNGVHFGGIGIRYDLPFITEPVVNLEEVYYTYQMNNKSSSVVSTLTTNGELQLFLGDNTSEDWRLLFKVPTDQCGTYAYCGPNAICFISGPQTCSCMTGYQPNSPQQWDIGVWSGGCVQKRQLNCSERQDFKEIEGVKMPDFVQYQVNLNMSLEECKATCLKNCSCTAYANANASGQPHGCLLWFGDLIDVRPLNIYADQKLALRVSASDLVSESGPNKKKKKIIILVTIAASVCLLSAVLFFTWRRKVENKGGKLGSDETEKENLELPLFNMVTITEATQCFSNANKIGEGGFGPVYKGKLQTGQEIAVKRLAESSFQGLNEFKNEVLLIAKLQHRNLVRLLGCCIHAEERMLIYEYMPNGSLDSFIFGGSNHTKRLLVWRRRYSIIIGISRGLLYLHRDSRLRIIHRDLKASNVLLDCEMNPKISDFGMARTFGEDQLITKTLRVVGTYGYMAPEYVIDGIFSMKSDIFSLGVLILEVVSGKRNSQFHHPDHDFNLLGHAWQLWLEGRAPELIDPSMEDTFPMSQVLRCIQVGLLCVQLRPEDRPDMSCVLQMLGSESSELPQPKRPGFFTERYFKETDSLLAGRWTPDESTRTTIEGR